MLRILGKFLLGLFFVAAGVNHFVHPAFYMSIMPPYLPWHALLVYLSGLIEMALGVAVLIPKFTRSAAWGLILLLLAVFPANIHMAANPQLYPDFSPLALWIRLPLQAVFIAWAFWFTRPAPNPPARAA
ncbi:MAG: DoxX family membrane protein [Planctomycetes bacterium]|nr:DoxX family membrane protein [Planctomycetota bacterium]